MIKIKIDDYRITNDDRQFILSRVRRDDQGMIKYTDNKEESISLIGYYQTLPFVLKAIQRDYVRSDGILIQSIEEYTEALERITRQFEQACEVDD